MSRIFAVLHTDPDPASDDTDLYICRRPNRLPRQFIYEAPVFSRDAWAYVGDENTALMLFGKEAMKLLRAGHVICAEIDAVDYGPSPPPRWPVSKPGREPEPPVEHISQPSRKAWEAFGKKLGGRQ